MRREANDLLTPEHVDALAAAAVAAPSADNRHSFSLRLAAGEVHLLATTDMLRAASQRRVLALISIGAVCENLILRGRRLGLHLDPTWHLPVGDDAILARLSCRAMAPQSDPLEAAIDLRQSNRTLRYRGPPLLPLEQTQLTHDAETIDGVSLAWLDEPARRRRALRLIRIAETERFRTKALHRELFDAIRFDVGWDSPADQGLPPGALGLSRLERPGFALLRRWHVQRFANLIGAHRLIGLRAAYLPCRLAPHLCVLSAEGPQDIAAVNSGRALQRVWLRATSLGYAVQLFVASALYGLEGLAEVGADLRVQLVSGWAALGLRGRPMAVLRLGHAKQASIRAGRVPASSIIVDTVEASN